MNTRSQLAVANCCVDSSVTGAPVEANSSTARSIGPASSRRTRDLTGVIPQHLLRFALALWLCAVMLALLPGGALAAAVPAISEVRASDSAPWQWPVRPQPEVTRLFDLPHRYAAGHRGIDLALAPGAEVHAVAAGTVRFVGVVVDRPVLSLQHPDGLISTYEPVVSDLARGDSVAAGDAIGTVSVEHQHQPDGGMHLGARRGDDYLDPLTLLGAVPRAVLLPLGP